VRRRGFPSGSAERRKDRDVAKVVFCPTCYWTRGENKACEWCRGYGDGRAASARGLRARLLVVAVMAATVAGAAGTIPLPHREAPAPSPVAASRPEARSYGYALPAGYRLRPWDEFKIHIFGKLLDETYPVAVDHNGYITVPRVGVVLVVGLKYGELNAFLYKEISRYISNFQLSTLMTRPGIDPESPLALQSPPHPQDMPNDRTLVPGTKIRIIVYSKLLNEQYDVEINADGRLVIPRAGELYVGGLKRGDLNPFLTQELSKYMRFFQVYTQVTPTAP
jgi:protein involved in polysaccharide export with SLBB domain